MNIVVTGGAGFIGSHLCEALLCKGNKVFVIDNFNNYYNPQIKSRNINDILDRMIKNNISMDNFIIQEVDIRDKNRINEIFKNDIDLVIHLAAMAGVRYSIENPELYVDVNIKGTMNILEACRENGIKKLIFASSSSVYGNNMKIPFSENDIVDNPISTYAATKKSGELLCHTYHYLYGFSVACLRFFTVYGPRQRPDLAIYKFVNQISKGEQIPFFGDGDTERDYTYISDIVDGIMKAISWVENNSNCYEIFNLGESKRISLKNMVETIENALDKRADKKMFPLQPGDVKATYANINKARNMLGYAPSMDFETGIKNFVSWFKDYDKR